MKLSRGWLATIIIVAVIVADQTLKIWVKTSFYYGEEFVIAGWFRLLFIENNGMAFGFEFGSKYILTWFRLLAVALLIYYITRLCRRDKLSTGFLVCVAMITAGAAGNVIDCLFYGLIFNAPVYPEVATLFPPDGGYAGLFNGRVVDMLYFPLVEWDWPGWTPWLGGEHFTFFKPVFNVADASLSVGVIVLILFYSKHLSTQDKTDDRPQEVAQENQE